jgi:glycogen(starch) synthase
MKILILTIPFAPERGGIETVVELLSAALAGQKHSVCVVTLQGDDRPNTFPFEVLRRPSPLQLVRAFWNSDRVLLHGPTLRLGWPLFFLTSRAWIVHHIWPPQDRGLIVRLLRKLFYWRCRHFAVSRALARAVAAPLIVVPNPFDDSRFKVDPNITRDCDIVVLGRLVELKGVHDFIDALVLLRAEGCTPSVTIIGDGPERQKLEQRVKSKTLDSQVRFVGSLPTTEVVHQLNRHRLHVVPSRYDEPFGVVALEGIACGCVIIGSAGGGLPEAIGPCGSTFPNGDVPALAAEIRKCLKSAKTPAEVVTQHLAPHRPTAVADCYVRLMKSVT